MRRLQLVDLSELCGAVRLQRRVVRGLPRSPAARSRSGAVGGDGGSAPEGHAGRPCAPGATGARARAPHVVALARAPARAAPPPLVALDGLADGSTTFVAVVISSGGVPRVSFPRASAHAFGVDGTLDKEAAYQAAHSLAPLIVTSFQEVESYLAG